MTARRSPLLKHGCPLLLQSQGCGCPLKPTSVHVRCLEIRKTEVVRHVFKKRSVRLDSHITIEVGLVDTHKKTVGFGKTILLS